MSGLGQPYVITVTDVERGIMALASKLLGSADAWRTLLSVNNLSPPYITLYPEQIYGPSLGKLILPQQTLAGADTLTIAGQPQSVNVAYFSFSGANGLVAEVATIANYNGTTLTLASPLKNTYPAGSQLALFASYSVGNITVLLPGQTIFLPVNGSNSLTLNTNAILTDVFGADFTLPYSFANGDLSQVTGVNTLNQRIRVAIETELSALPLYQDFGSELNGNIGTSSASAKWTAFVREALMKLPEIENVTNLQVTVNNTSLIISGLVWVTTSNTPIQINNMSFTLAR